MRLLKLIVKLRLLGLTLLLVLSAGCSRLIVYPINDTDIQVTGDEETGTVTMSQWYFKNVLKVKLEKGR